MAEDGGVDAAAVRVVVVVVVVVLSLKVERRWSGEEEVGDLWIVGEAIALSVRPHKALTFGVPGTCSTPIST